MYLNRNFTKIFYFDFKFKIFCVVALSKSFLQTVFLYLKIEKIHFITTSKHTHLKVKKNSKNNFANKNEGDALALFCYIK
jgi:hypothetical protein